jgi:RNA polymerase sigma factor (sigma-70 family)
MAAYSTHTDQELVPLLKDGDQYAYTELYNRYKTLLYVFSLRRLANREEAKDLIQELFLTLWSKREELAIIGSFKTYVFTALRNKILDVIAHQKVSSRYLDSFQSYIDGSEGTTDHLVRTKELMGLIEKEISMLPPKMREVFELSGGFGNSRQVILKPAVHSFRFKVCCNYHVNCPFD